VEDAETLPIVFEYFFTAEARPPVAITSHGKPSSAISRSTRPSTREALPWMTPDFSASGVLRPRTRGGSAISTRESLAARERSASSATRTPGTMTPPRYSPLGETALNVVAVPKSTTMTPPCTRSNAATASAMRSGPTSRGLS
jgi:hypothetical protein